MKRIIKFIGLILLAFSFSLVIQSKKEQRENEIEKHNVWVNAGVIDHKDFKNKSLMVVENGI